MNLNKKVAFYTLGCKVNQYETESIKNQCVKLGYSEVDFNEIADIYIINSCTVTSIADKKTRNMLRRAKKNNGKAIIILTGCYAETNSKELKDMEEIDYIIGNKDKQGVLNLLRDIENKQETRFEEGTIFDQAEYEEYEFATLREMSRAFIKIQDGCNSFCSYCKIPFARGKSRSRKMEKIIEEVKKVVSQGYKEIVLIGINIGAYGEDFQEKKTFEELVRNIINIEGVERIRFGSVYPDKISDEFIELFSSKKVLPHIHLSIQSGDTTVLRMMKRKYDSDLIKNSCKRIKSRVKELELTADIIVGFPGETQEMFENTYRTLKEIGFADLHVFQYSDREGTLASTFADKIDNKVKKERALELEKLRDEMLKITLDKYEGKVLEVLIEENKESGTLGHSNNFLKIKIKKQKLEVGEILSVRIIGREKEVLIGEKIN